MSFISGPTVEQLKALMIRAHQTTIVLNGSVNLVLSRWSEEHQSYFPLEPQEVVREPSRFAPTETLGPGTTFMMSDGAFSKPEPFDVERGDVFALGPEGDEERGEITIVHPPDLGIIRADFKYLVGEQ